MDPVSQNIRFNWLIFLSFVAIYLVWGSTYLAIRIPLECFPPFLLSGIIIALMVILTGVLVLNIYTTKK